MVATEPRNILLVQLDHLGDAVLSTPLVHALRQRYPEARLEVLAAPWNREVFAGLPQVDRVHVSCVNRFGRGWHLGWRLAWPAAMLWWGWKLRTRRYDLAIDVRGELPCAMVLWLCGAARRVGWSCGGGGFLLTTRAAYQPGRAEVESRRALLETLEIPTHEGLAFRPRFEPTAAARRRVARRLRMLDVDRRRPLFVLHVGAGTRAKHWPREHWEELLGRIALECAAQVVLVGSPDDTAFVREICGGRNWPDVIDWTGRLNIAELAALIELAEVFIGGDSGPAHLAAAVNTPAIVLFSGATDPHVWQPRGRRVVVLRHEVACSPCHAKACPLAHHACMQGLGPQTVIEAIHKLRANTGGDDAPLEPLPLDLVPLPRRLAT